MASISLFLRIAFFTALSKGLFLYLAESHQIYVDRWVATLFGLTETMTIQAPGWVVWIVAGGVGVLFTTIWEIAKYQGRFPWQKPSLQSDMAALEFDFRPEDNKYLELVQQKDDGENKECLVGRVATKNALDSEPLPAVRTVLIHQRPEGGKYRTLDFRLTSYSSGLNVEDLPPRQSITYDLFRIFRSGDSYRLELGPDIKGQYERIPLGRYRLKITASTTKEGAQHLPGFFVLNFNDNGEIEYGPEDDETRRIQQKLDL